MMNDLIILLHNFVSHTSLYPNFVIEGRHHDLPFPFLSFSFVECIFLFFGINANGSMHLANKLTSITDRLEGGSDLLK